MKTWKKTTRESAKTQDERAEGKRKEGKTQRQHEWVRKNGGEIKKMLRNNGNEFMKNYLLFKILSRMCSFFLWIIFFLCWRVGIFICIFAALIIGFAQKLQKNYPSAGRFLRCSAQLNFIRLRKSKWVCEKFQIHFGPKKKRIPENSPFWNSAW